MKKEKFIIKGRNSLNGEVKIRGAKNAAFPALVATLLTKEPSVIDNLPLIEDVFRMIDLLKGLGVKISWLGKRKVRLDPSGIDPLKIPFDIVGFFRGSILLLGPLLARFNRIKMPPPGGCLIGARSIDTHLDAFSQLGVKIIRGSMESSSKRNNKQVRGDNLYSFEKGKNFAEKFHTVSFLKEKNETREVVLREFSVTATENILLFSALFPGKTILKIADQDYQVKELIKVLEKMGVKIKSNGPSSLEVIGQKTLHGFNYTVISDPIETGTFIVAALATKGEIVIRDAQLSFLDLFLKRLWDFGAKFKILDEKTIKIFPSEKLKIDKVQSLPYPGIHSDIQPELGVLATQTEGPTLMHDPLYEGRLKYLDELNKMGAKIIFCGPHRAIIYGKTQLEGVKFPSPDLRAGAALIIAGLVAEGKTIIDNIYQVDRGYEKIEERLRRLGANIIRVKE